MAAELLKNPEQAADTLVREELGLDPDDLGSPLGAAGSSFVMFAVGATVPLVPFLLTSGTPAVVAATALGLRRAGRRGRLRRLPLRHQRLALGGAGWWGWRRWRPASPTRWGGSSGRR